MPVDAKVGEGSIPMPSASKNGAHTHTRHRSRPCYTVSPSEPGPRLGRQSTGAHLVSSNGYVQLVLITLSQLTWESSNPKAATS